MQFSPGNLDAIWQLLISLIGPISCVSNNFTILLLNNDKNILSRGGLLFLISILMIRLLILECKFYLEFFNIISFAYGISFSDKNESNNKYPQLMKYVLCNLDSLVIM